MDTEIKPKPVKARADWDKRLRCWVIYYMPKGGFIGICTYSLRPHDTAVKLITRQQNGFQN